MNKRMKTLLTAMFMCCTAILFAQQTQTVPTDPKVRIGKLENGLTYYIRQNALPEGQADFYIAQKVGSILEEESQRGLAHFLEHMCFNGTKHFPNNRLREYLENIGVKFGVNLNAYTAMDETVYNINNVPIKKVPEAVDSCLWILRDWSDGLTLGEEEIDFLHSIPKKFIAKVTEIKPKKRNSKIVLKNTNPQTLFSITQN